MGLNQSKPENPYVRDRVRLCDGLAPFQVVHAVAAAGAGRFVFILGEEIQIISDEPEPTTFQLDYVDLMLSTRVRLTVDPFDDFGDLSAFYALDERTIVLVDVKEREDTLRQRLVVLDPEKATAHAIFDRGYKLKNRASHLNHWDSAVSEDRVITKTMVLSFNPHTVTHMAIVYPKNPLNCEMKVIDLTAALDKIGVTTHRLRRELDSAEYNFRLSSEDAPFFVSPTKVGLFVRRHDLRAARLRRVPGSRLSQTDVLWVDHSYFAVYDLQSKTISIVRAHSDPVTNFPYNHEHRPPCESHSLAVSSRQIGLLVTDKYSTRGWNIIAARLLEILAGWMACALRFFRREPFEIRRFHDFFMYQCSLFLSMRRWMLGKKKVRFGLLDTRTMQWREQPGVADQLEFEHLNKVEMAVFHDGHSLIYNQNNSKVASRAIGTHSRSSQWPTEELRILTNPGRCFSLRTLAEMRLRKKPIACLAIMQIAAKIQI